MIKVDSVCSRRELSGVESRSTIDIVVTKVAEDKVVSFFAIESIVFIITVYFVISTTSVDIFYGDEAVVAVTSILE